MAVGTGGARGGGLAPPLFRDVKKKSMVKMHLNDANGVWNSEKFSGSLRSPFHFLKQQFKNQYYLTKNV